ncbi:MAG TPA: UbiA prenyltransferase family protein [Solirubrobacterales bacterium]|nr:UbiA prenyltransferase family protein [Solirubrobacterales bacterium]
MPPLIRALRPGEWVKNLLVFAGLVFSGQLDEGDQVLAATLSFIAFCGISSAGYLFNDLRDREHDRQHPDKRNRPLATGALSVPTAIGAAVTLAAGALGLGFAVEPEVGGMVALYGAITTAYSLILKRLVIVDVMTIGSLFILRVIAGAVAVEAQASEYLLVCTGFLALFLGFTKRRQEAMLEEAPPNVEQVSRPVLEHYSLPFLDQMIAMVTSASIISYVIYAVNSPIVGSKMLITAPSVLYGIFRYLYLIYDRRDTRSTAAILAKDPGIIFAGASWAGAAILALYVLD